MKPDSTKQTSPICLIALLAALTFAAGCEALGGQEEDKITPQEIAAADAIRVTFRNFKPTLMPHVTVKYIRDGRLYIDGEILNTGEVKIDDASFRAFAFDELDRLIESDLPLIYLTPRTLQPSVAGHFSLDLDATGVTLVTIEEADQ